MSIRKKYPLILLALVIASLLLMTYQVRSKRLNHSAFAIFSPVFEAIDFVINGVQETWDDYLFLVGTEAENRELRLRIEKFDIEGNNFREILAENRRLQTLLDLKEAPSCSMTAAVVIAGDPNDWSHTITINKGSKDGMAVNMAVIGARGLAGRIYAVSPGSSKVLLITDFKSSVAVRFQTSREEAIMDGGGDSCNLKYVHKDTLVESGEGVITSGLDGIFPEGIFVGVVQKVKQLDYGIFQEVTLVPSEHLNSLEEALVIVSGSSCINRKRPGT